jgi:hypothetical protein
MKKLIIILMILSSLIFMPSYTSSQLDVTKTDWIPKDIQSKIITDAGLTTTDEGIILKNGLKISGIRYKTDDTGLYIIIDMRDNDESLVRNAGERTMADEHYDEVLVSRQQLQLSIAKENLPANLDELNTFIANSMAYQWAEAMPEIKPIPTGDYLTLNDKELF